MASPRFDASPSQLPALDVHRLDTEAAVSGDAESVVMVKLTDEMIAAIQRAQKSRTQNMRIRIQPQGGEITLCGRDSNSVCVFRFQVQSLPGPPADAIGYDRNGGYKAAAAVHSKYQIQATDRSFEETREKTKKLKEEEMSRTAKDMSRQRVDQRPVAKRVIGGSSGGSSSTSRVRSPYLKSSANNDPNQRISPNKFGNSTGSSVASATSNGLHLGAGAVRPSMSSSLRAELLRKKLRVRVVHLIVTGRFCNVDDLMRRLRKDGLNEKEDDIRKIEALVQEVSELGSDEKLVLRPAFYGEVDPRWPWFTTEEKATVRRIVQGLPAVSNGFAPTRKSGVERMQAPSQPSSQDQKENKKSPDTKKESLEVPAPPPAPTLPVPRASMSAGGMIGGGRKVSPQIARTTPQPAKRTPHKDSPHQTSINLMDEILPPTGQKRKAHVPTGTIPEKRPRQESASPPEDPTTNQPVVKVQRDREQSRSGGSNGGSSVSSSASSSSSSGASSRLSSPRTTLASPSQPSQDWSKMYAEVKTVNEAEKYYQLFCDDYPEYMKCFGKLNKVSQEFRTLADSLDSARRSRNSDDLDRVERDIQNKYHSYEKDSDFLRVRQRHADLRSKLHILKRRIATWEERTSQTPLTSTEPLFAL